jgi:hypothetical protein
VAVTRLTALLNIREVGERVFSDLAETWWMIGISLVGACLLSFIWILLMRFLAGNPIFLADLFPQVSADFLRCGYPDFSRIFLPSRVPKDYVADAPQVLAGIFSSQVPYTKDRLIFLLVVFWLARIHFICCGSLTEKSPDSVRKEETQKASQIDLPTVYIRTHRRSSCSPF